jgi:hypothetical protein
MGETVTQSHHWYAPGNPDNPRHDPTYIERVAECLLEHRGECVHLEPLVGGDPWTLNESVNCLRRLGWEIDGDRGKVGYVFVKWQRPQRWTRLDSVYREHIGSIVKRPKRHRCIAPMAGQMELCP